ncbi:MAG: NLP/P60-family protein [Thermoleophilia bacterium]|nr:NLP/P60-family protein [Thermoleophilia bacterium]
MRLPFLAAGAAVAIAATPTGAQAAPVRTTLAQRVQAANLASRKAGAPYQWGAVGPRRFDCSGLVVFAYNAIRHPLGVRTTQEFWSLGARVPRAKLRKGDFVFTWARNHGHMGIYLGQGRYVHAPGSGRRVTIAPLPAGGGFIGAVRP